MNEIIIKSIVEYITEIHSITLSKNIIFRGQSNKTYSLLPKIARESIKLKCDALKLEEYILDEFKKYVSVLY